MAKPFLLVSLLLALFVLSLSNLTHSEWPADPVCAATNLVDDPFNGTMLDRCKWDEVSQSGGQFTVNEEAIATTSAASAFSIPRMTSQYRLTGDFDMQVDYRIGSGWTDPLPPNSGLEIQMAAYWDDSRYVQIGRGRDAGGEYIKPATPIASQGGINSIRVANSQTSGKFRIARTGTTLSLRYHNGSTWIEIATATVPAEDAYVYLGSISGNASRAFTAYFDDFALNAGATSFHPFVRNPSFKKRPDFYVGGVVCDYMAFQNWGNTWNGINPLDPLKQNGFKWVRVGVTTGSSQFLANTPPAQWPTLPWRDEYWSSREFAGQIMREAQDRGYRLNLFLFLSNTAAHAGQQNAPPEWAGLSVAETAQRVDQYSFDIATYYMQHGLNVEVYDVGNEVDFGILNFRPGERIPIPPGVDIVNDTTWMRENVWNVNAQLFQASINGIKRANPNAKIVIHAAGINVSRSNAFVKEFFRAMNDYGVQYDYAGLSNPYNQTNWVVPSYSTDCWFQRLQEIIDYLGQLGKPVIFSEASYPHNSNGTFGTAMPEFPYSPSGQAAWAREHLRFLSNQANVKGFFWFYPDYHMNLSVDPGLKGSSLFQTPTQPMPALAEFRVNLDRPVFDYDGDGKTDYSVFRPSSGAWYLQRSTAGFAGLQFGAGGDKLTPADYDGDGKTDIAVYRPSSGTWYILRSANGTVDYPVFGVAEDIPAPGDYDGDGKADLTVFRPSQGQWYRTNSSNGSFFAFPFGANGDVPTVGDFDGDGKNDIGIWRPSNGDWYNIRSSNGSVFGERFGQTGDKIAPADYDGDGKTDIAIYRPSTGLWVVRNSATATYSYYVFGAPSDIPISGDYDGDGRADIGVWRPSDGTWYIQRSSNSQFIVFPWGQNGDGPTPAAYGN